METGQVLSGAASLDLWVAMEDFDAHEAGVVRASLSSCNASGLSCTTLATGNAAIDQDDAPGTFQLITLDFGTVTASIPPGRTLVVKVVVDGESADDMFLAYGTTAFPAALRLNQP